MFQMQVADTKGSGVLSAVRGGSREHLSALQEPDKGRHAVLSSLWKETVMKKANLLFDFLYVVGIALAFLAFFIFVPEAGRTRVAWLNFGIGLLIYTGYWGQWMVLFRPLQKFADDVPFFSSYWIWWTVYVGLAVVGMIAFQFMHLEFRKQVLLQGIFFFFLLCALALGIWAASWLKQSSERDKRTMGGVRNIQYHIASLRIAASELPEAYHASKVELGKIMDDMNCIAGSSGEQSCALESQILTLMGKASQGMLNGISREELDQIIKDLRMAVSMRKAI